MRMNPKTRTFLSGLLTVVLVAGLCPSQALAAQGGDPDASVEAAEASNQQATGSAQAEDTVAVEDLRSVLEGLDIDDGSVVEIGYDPLFPDDGCTIEVRPAADVESAAMAVAESELSAALSVNSSSLEDVLLAGWDTCATAIDVSSFGYVVADDGTFARFFEDDIDVILEHPDRFNVRTALVVSYNPDTRSIASVRPSYLASTASEYQTMKAAYEEGVSRALARVTDSMNDISKVYVLHDWLCDRATYNYEAAAAGSGGSEAHPRSFTAYGCVAEGLGVCQSYTLALADMLDRAGVENAPLLVDAMDHAWNMVRIGGFWYNVDATWDDSGAERANSGSSAYVPSYSYFLQSEDKFEAGEHYGWIEEGTYGYDEASMAATDTRYDNENWSLYAPEGNEMCAALSSSRAGDLTLITKRSANTMGKESPMRFYAQAWGGTGDYVYSFESPQVFDGVDQFTTLVDPVNQSFNEEYGYKARGSFSFEFFATDTYRLRTHVLDKRYGSTPTASASNTFSLSLSDALYPSVTQRVNRIAATCESTVGADASQYEKALWLHDYLIDNAEYDLRYVKAEGVLARGRGNCESYHAAYVRLLNAVGINAGRIDSIADNHVWTAAKLDGEWCQIDVTWDDCDFGNTPIDMRHLYFGLTDELMGYAHKGHTEAVPGYESNSLQNNYLIKSGALEEHVDELAIEMVNQLEKGSTSFELCENNASYPHWAQAYDGAIKTIYNSLLAHELERRRWEIGLNGASNVAVLNISYLNESNGKDPFIFSGSFAVTAEFQAVDGHVHQWGTPNTIKQPTCTTSGQQAKACAICGVQVTESIAATGHAWSSYAVTKKPTCIDAGQSVSTCTRCGQQRTQVVNATDHAWSGWSLMKAPTVSSEGAESRVCANCDAKQTRSVAKLPAKDRWVSSGGRWWYAYGAGGYPANCWAFIGGSWYHFDAAGWMQTGWLKDGGTWYYLSSSGAMKTGWLKLGGTWYYLSASGAMKTGWLKLGSTWYYLKSSGAMATGWCRVGGSWYWFDSSGAMGSNRWVGNYYLTSSGAMATNQWIGRYHVNANGLWDKSR